MATPELKPVPAVAGGKRIEVPIKKATGPGDDKVHTWPHLVRAEFLMAIGITLLLLVWSLLSDAPLEEPAVGSHPGHARLDLQLGRLDEGLEPEQTQLVEFHISITTRTYPADRRTAESGRGLNRAGE